MLRKFLLVVLIILAIIIPVSPASPSSASGIPARTVVSSSPSIHCVATVVFKIANLCIRDLKQKPFTFGIQPTRVCVQEVVNLIQQRESRISVLSTSTTLKGGECYQVQGGGGDISLNVSPPPHPLLGIKLGYLGGWNAYQNHRGIIRQVPCQGRTDFFTLYLKGGGKVCLADHGLIRLRLPPFTRVCGGRNTGDVVGAQFSIHLKGWGDCASVPGGVSMKSTVSVYIRPLHFGAGSLF